MSKKFNGKRRIFGVLVIALFVLVSCMPVLASPGAHELIIPQQLEGLVNSNNLVVVDIRDAAAYKAGHIPGAVWLNKSEIYETVEGVKSMAATPEKLAALLGTLGIFPKTHIVVYSAANDVKSATRFWWTLEMYSFKNVQVLDGGFGAWTDTGYATSTVPVVPVKATYPSSDLIVNPDAVATLQEVKDGLSSGAVVIDCRSQAYFDGTLTKFPRAGHIDGAILVSELDMLNTDYTFRDKNELRKYFAEKGITAKTPVILYCNTGTTATVQFLALKEILGFKDVQNYDGSLTEWTAYPELPMAM